MSIAVIIGAYIFSLLVLVLAFSWMYRDVLWVRFASALGVTLWFISSTMLTYTVVDALIEPANDVNVLNMIEVFYLISIWTTVIVLSVSILALIVYIVFYIRERASTVLRRGAMKKREQFFSSRGGE